MVITTLAGTPHTRIASAPDAVVVGPAHERAGRPFPPTGDDLNAARSKIERLDRALVRLIGARLRVASVVAAAKRAEGIPLFDPGQEARVIRRAGEWAREDALPEEDVRHLFWRLIAITRHAQGVQP